MYVYDSTVDVKSTVPYLKAYVKSKRKIVKEADVAYFQGLYSHWPYILNPIIFRFGWSESDQSIMAYFRAELKRKFWIFKIFAHCLVRTVADLKKNPKTTSPVILHTEIDNPLAYTISYWWKKISTMFWLRKYSM